MAALHGELATVRSAPPVSGAAPAPELEQEIASLKEQLQQGAYQAACLIQSLLRRKVSRIAYAEGREQYLYAGTMIHNELGVPGYQWDGELDMIGNRALFFRQRRAERIVHGSYAIEHSGGTQAQAPELSLLEEPESAAVIVEGNSTDDYIRSSELEAEVEVEHEAETEAESGAESEEAEEPRAESDVSTENEPHSHEEKDVEEEEEEEQRELPVLESHMSRRLAVQLEEVLSRADEGVVMTAATKITTATTTANVAAADDNKDDDTVTVIAIAAGAGSSFLSEEVRAAKSADEENEGPFRLERTDETMSFQDVSSLSSHPSFAESLPRNAFKQSASKLAMLRAEESWLESSIRDRIAYLSRR